MLLFIYLFNYVFHFISNSTYVTVYLISGPSLLSAPAGIYMDLSSFVFCVSGLLTPISLGWEYGNSAESGTLKDTIPDMNDEELTELHKAADNNQDRWWNYDEFLEWKCAGEEQKACVFRMHVKDLGNSLLKRLSPHPR